jgi:CreA protein
MPPASNSGSPIVAIIVFDPEHLNNPKILREQSLVKRMPQVWKIALKAGILAIITFASAVVLASCEKRGHVIGSVNTEFKLVGPDHKIVVESYDDPKIEGITVFVSKSQTGGIKGALGLAEDTSNASVAVRQTGPIKVKEAFENGEDVFTEKRSLVFKRMHVSRFWDPSHDSFVYVVWTDRFIKGSPQNSISAVVAEPWGTQPPDISLMKRADGAPPA